MLPKVTLPAGTDRLSYLEASALLRDVLARITILEAGLAGPQDLAPTQSAPHAMPGLPQSHSPGASLYPDSLPPLLHQASLQVPLVHAPLDHA